MCRHAGRFLAAVVAVATAFTVAPWGPGSVPGAYAADLPDPVPVPSLPPIGDAAVTSERLVPVPSGCPQPPEEQVVFVGTMLVNDTTTARFVVDQVRSGSTQGFTAAGQIDIRYGDEVRFLEPGAQYIVGAAVDPELRALVSKVREPAPLFGGSEIAGLNTSDVVCPTLDDPVRTLRADGTGVETGVFSSLDGSGGMVLRAVFQPLVAAFAILLGLAALKLLVFAMARSLRDLGDAG